MIGALFTNPTGPADGGLAVRPFINEDSHGFELFDPDTGDVAAIIHDGADRGDGEAQAIAENIGGRTRHADPVARGIGDQSRRVRGRCRNQWWRPG